MAESNDTVRVAVRIRPLSDYEIIQDSSQCVTADTNGKQIRGGLGTAYTFDNVFSPDTSQADIYEDCVSDLLNAVFEGFNATILAYGQTGSGKTYTMGSSADQIIAEETAGIIPRFIKNLFHMIGQKEDEDPNHAFKVYVQFLEIYGEDIRDLLDQTRTSKVVVRETRNGEVFLTGAREELVSSFEQMMKALEDGTRNRTTSSTKMNLTSSRSHAIFTVNLEHTIYTEVVKDGSAEAADVSGEAETKKRLDSEPLNREVRKSKFHFVDLAGSERIKRTGAEGVRMKEGIDINKGLLALGNVISALGDESKRGKVFVPYRDSKLTRMLRDSLGGNSKTLMICCVSPAAINYNESLNALRYANRARNIKNKPIINRDPTLVMVDQMRSTLKVVCSELLEIRKRKQYAEIDSRVTDSLLEQWALGGGEDGNTLSFVQQKLDKKSLLTSGEGSGPISSSSTKPTIASSTASSLEVKRIKEQLRERDDLILELKRKANDADFEAKRLTELLKYARQQTSEASDQLLLVKSEADYFRLKWIDAAPQDAIKDGVDIHHMSSVIGDTASLLTNTENIDELSPALREKVQFVNVFSKLKKEIEDLRKDLAIEKANSQKHEALNELDNLTLDADTDFTATIASLIAQTRTHLQEETRRLHDPEAGGTTNASGNLNGNNNIVSGNAITKSASADEGTAMQDVPKESPDQQEHEQQQENEELELEREYAKRQRMLSSEVQELGQSIVLKEQLLAQLVKSQEQYARMKTFYETRLQQLSTEMQEKQEEREKLLYELQEIAEKNSEAEVLKVRETKLREELRHKDEELKVMKKKQQELRSLAHAQSQYTAQLTKLESDIVSMKKQRVDLAKQLQLEKKNHIAALTEKAREIDRLKRELAKASAEVKRLGKVSETAEQKMKDALREGAMLKKKATDFARLQEVASATNTRLALKAISTATAKQRAVFSGNTATGSSRRSMSEEEIRVRKWLQQRVGEISSKEAAVESLKQQYEQQLELLQRLEELESERSESSGGKHGRHQFGATAPRSKEDEEKLFEVLDDRVSALNGQLNAKAQKIADLRGQITQCGDAPGADKVLEMLRKQLQSLPAAQEMVRTLFDMLIGAQKAVKLSKDRADEFAEKEMTYQQKIDDLYKQNASEKRSYDMELTMLTKEYEEKYQHLFQHLTVVGESYNHLYSAATSNSSVTSVDGSASMTHNNSHNTSNNHLTRKESSFDPMQMQLAISGEETKFLRQQLDREALKYSQLQGKFSDLEKIKTGLVRDIAEKNNTIRFLEEERSLFKAMAEEMKAALHSLGKDGKLMVQSIKGKAPRASRANGLFNEYLNSDSDDNFDPGLHSRRYQSAPSTPHSQNWSFSGDDADESQSVLGEFDSLVEEINRTGNVSDPLSGFVYVMGTASGSTTPGAPSSYSGQYLSSGPGSKSESIVERLTNPSNFTGSIKTVFKEDLASKRMKTQQIRNQEKHGAHNSKREGFFVTSGTTGAGGGGGGGGSAVSSSTSSTVATATTSAASSSTAVTTSGGTVVAGYMAATISSNNNNTNVNNGASGGSNAAAMTSLAITHSAMPPSTPQSTRDSTRRFFSDAVLAASNSNSNSSSSGSSSSSSTTGVGSYNAINVLSGKATPSGGEAHFSATPGPDEIRRSLRMTRTNSVREANRHATVVSTPVAAAAVQSTTAEDSHSHHPHAAENPTDDTNASMPTSASKAHGAGGTGANVFARLASQHIASSYTRHALARAASVGAGNSSSISGSGSSSSSGVTNTNTSTSAPSGEESVSGGRSGSPNHLRLSQPLPSAPGSSQAPIAPPAAPEKSSSSSSAHSIVVNGKTLPVLSTAHTSTSRSSSASSANSPVNNSTSNNTNAANHTSKAISLKSASRDSTETR
jgi:kinesin family protein 4/21/27